MSVPLSQAGVYPSGDLSTCVGHNHSLGPTVFRTPSSFPLSFLRPTSMPACMPVCPLLRLHIYKFASSSRPVA